jgi:hypothetical protein
VSPGEHDVLRLEVAVDEAMAVGVDQRVEDILEDSDRVLRREPTNPGQSLPESLSLDIGHHVVERARPIARLAGILSRIDEGQDVRVLQVGGDAYLAEKPLAAERGGQLGPDHLDGDLAIVLQVVC